MRGALVGNVRLHRGYHIPISNHRRDPVFTIVKVARKSGEHTPAAIAPLGAATARGFTAVERHRAALDLPACAGARSSPPVRRHAVGDIRAAAAGERFNDRRVQAVLRYDVTTAKIAIQHDVRKPAKCANHRSAPVS